MGGADEAAGVEPAPAGPCATGPSRGLVLLALLSVYVAWGSTYLAIRIALTGLPPLLLSGVRALVAGTLLLGWAWWRGEARATREAVANAVLAGVLLVGGGNGLVTVAEQWVSSGLAAAIAATGSLWIVLMLAWLGEKPSRAEQAGIAIGVVGVLLLNADGELRASPAGALALLGATLAWALGSVVSRRRLLPAGVLAVAVELLAGGALLTAAGALHRERLAWEALRMEAVLAWFYLVVAGSLVGFTAFTFLIRNVRPALATSFVYVNPVVAVLLGVAVGGETLTPLAAAGIAVSVLGLFVVTFTSRSRG